MKSNIAKTLLTLAVIIGFICLFGEIENTRMQLVWTLAWMVELAITGKALMKYYPGEEEI